jgi:hypothetical protein
VEFPSKFVIYKIENMERFNKIVTDACKQNEWRLFDDAPEFKKENSLENSTEEEVR